MFNLYEKHSKNIIKNDISELQSYKLCHVVYPKENVVLFAVFSTKLVIHVFS